ncbi:MAG: MGDG synthase family glycosyltransferase, partial [Oscillospiraceae bacterium]
MKVLVLSATIGQGHNACAKAIKTTFEEMGCNVKIIDMYGYVNKYLKNVISKGYNTSINISNLPYLRFLGTLTYSSMESTQQKEKNNKGQIIDKVICTQILKLISKEDPNVIICTQVNCANVISYLKKEKVIKKLSIGIITDFTVQSHWKHAKNLDYIITPSKNLNFKLLNLGIKLSQILPIGIPIDKKFSKSLDLKTARNMLNIDHNKKTILLMGGSMGFGQIEKDILKLDKLNVDFQMLVVCGNNDKLYDKLLKLKTIKTIKIYGYTKKINLMMDASDVI